MLEELLFRILFISIYAAFAGIRIYYRRKSRKSGPPVAAKQRGTGQIGGKAGIVLSIGILGMLTSVILYLLIPPQIQWFPLPLPSMVRWAGVILGFTILPFLRWIHRTLGLYYSPVLQIKKEHTLVTTGPYSRIRHPMYTIFMLFILSTMLITANLLVAIFAIIVIITFFPISKKEEQMLLDQFGKKYKDYMKRAGRFLPRIRQPESNRAHPRRRDYRSSS